MKLRAILIVLAVMLRPEPADSMNTSSLAEPPPLPGGVRSASKPELARQIEELFRLQDDSARGSADSLQAQKALLVKIGGGLSEIPLDNAAPLAFHAAAYVLSGGNPEATDRFSHAVGITDLTKVVLQASAAFMRGERDDARKLLGAIDPATLPPFLGGRLALARAVVAEPNSELQQDDLAFAIASMPGTLVEESALRRSALAYGETGNENRFYKRLARYARRFPASIFADSFWNDVTRIMASRDLKDPDGSFTRFNDVLLIAGEARRKKIYLDLARAAAIAGKRVLMESAAGKLRELSDTGSNEEKIGRLYQNLYAVAEAEDVEALRALESISPDGLEEIESSLRSAAIALGQGLLTPLKPPEDNAGLKPEDPSPLMERANTLLGQSSDVLSKLRS